MKTDHRSGRAYTQVELDFIKDHADLRLRKLTELFNGTFGRYAEPKYIARRLRMMGIEPNIRVEHKYGEEQMRWLADNTPIMSEKELAAAFNSKYGGNVSADSLATYVRRFIGVTRTRETVRASHSKALRRFEVGDTSIHVRGGRKTKVILTEINGKRRWKPYGKYVWEQANGTLPNGWSVIFLNGDNTDCRLENLYAIGPDVMALMARNQWFSWNPDMTMTAIKLCELARLSNGQIRI